MRNKIFGAIGAIWGLLILVNGLMVGPVEGGESYQMGRLFALGFGGVLSIVGVVYFFKKPED